MAEERVGNTETEVKEMTSVQKAKIKKESKIIMLRSRE